VDGIYSVQLSAQIEAFLASEKPKVTDQGYQMIRKLVRDVGIWLEDEELESAAVGVDEALRYQVKLSTALSSKGRPYNAGTINNHLKAARRFFDYLVKTGTMRTNPFREIRRVRIGEHLSENALTVEQMGKLLGALSHFDEARPWWKVLKTYKVHVAAELMYSCGLRASEAAALEPGDLDLREKTVWVRSNRSGQARLAFLSSYAAEVLEEYLRRRELVFHDYERIYEHTLFGAGHGRLTAVINEVLAETCSALQLPLITSYGLRTSLGVHLTESGCDLRHVQLLLGLRHVGSTQVYMKRCKESLRSAVDAAHPRASWEARS
jgi:site-specific recombinase XerD